ncbi:MAG: hypothetical protein ACFCAD_04240 [Pleurocapsa sp.]
MTAQECDRFIYNNDTLYIVGIDGEGLFDPQDHGIKVVPISTACWRGYYCVYGILNNFLYLQEAYLGLDKENERGIQKGNGIKLFGTTPHRYKYIDGEIVKIDISTNFNESKKINSAWDFRCDNLNQLIEFTGGILIGSNSMGRINSFPYNYSKVYELVFDAGRVVETSDRSQKMADFRHMLASNQLEFNTAEKYSQIENWLNQCFSWNYKRFI